MRPTVVYVHGNGNKPAKESLKSTWDEALFGASAGRRSQMAYWADLRYPAPLSDARSDGLEAAEVGEESVGQDSLDPAELVIDTLVEARSGILVEAATPASGDSRTTGGRVPGADLDAWLRKMAYMADAVVEGETTGEAPSANSEVLWLPRAGRIAVFRALVKRTFADVYAYFFGGFGDAMRTRLRSTLAEVDGPVAVIGHSLGSIIAYDVLRESGPAREIPLFVTVGSPLGVTEIQDLVTSPLRVPDGVTMWRNVADGRDLVALDRTIRPEYAPSERTADFLVVNDSANHHGIQEYLSSGPVRSAVAALIS